MYKKLKNNLKSKLGGALIYVVLLVTVVTAAGIVIYKSSDEGMQNAERSRQQSQAYYNAKSGIEIAVGQILYDIDAEFDNVKLYGKLGHSLLSDEPIRDEKGNEIQDFYVTINTTKEGSETKYLITSIGYSYGSTVARAEARAASLNFQITKDDLLRSVEGRSGDDIGVGDNPILSSDFTSNYALFTQNNIDLYSGSPTIIGQIGTNSGPVELCHAGRVIAANGSNGIINLGPGAEIYYPEYRDIDFDVVYFDEAVPFPQVPDLPQAPEVPALPGIPRNSGIAWVSNELTGGVVELASGAVNGYRRVSLEWNDILTFRLNGDAVVVVENYSSTGEVKVEGNGKLLLVIKDGLGNNNRTMINKDGDREQLAIYYDGNKISLGSASSISGTIYAPEAGFNSTNPTDIDGDIIIGGKELTFSSLRHNGNLYATNKDAVITYTGSRPLENNVVTNIYSEGKELNMPGGNLKGGVYLVNSNAKLTVGGSSTLEGNIITAGREIDFAGGSAIDGHIVSDNPDATVSIREGAAYSGCIVMRGKKVMVSGGTGLSRSFVFAPNALVEISGGSHVVGGIISDSFVASGGVSLNYEKIKFENLPVGVEPIEDSSERANWRVYGQWIKG
jgi:hypothetical protein